MRKITCLFYASVMLLGFITAAIGVGDNWYVTPEGDGSFNGTNWANAFSNVQDAVDLATNDGDVVYLKYGTYTRTSQIEISNVQGLTIKGGYVGSGAPGARTNEYSEVTRGSGYIRLFSIFLKKVS